MGPLFFFAKQGQAVRIQDDIIGEVILYPIDFLFFFSKSKVGLIEVDFSSIEKVKSLG